jgi:hypothetical protein
VVDTGRFKNASEDSKESCHFGEPAVTPIRFFMGENYIEEVPIYDATVKFNGLLRKARRLLPSCGIDLHPEPIGLWPLGHWHMHHEIEVGGVADGNPAFAYRRFRANEQVESCSRPLSGNPQHVLGESRGQWHMLSRVLEL